MIRGSPTELDFGSAERAGLDFLDHVRRVDGRGGKTGWAVSLRRQSGDGGRALGPGFTWPETRHRRIAPYRLLFANGMWYVAAWDMERDALRFFRMDRVLDATLGTEQAPAAPHDLDEMLSGSEPFRASDEVEVHVRYSKRIARWIVERAPSAQLEDDGSAVVAHRVADRHWLVRHVLQYGGEAWVEEPQELRERVARSARQLAGR